MNKPLTTPFGDQILYGCDYGLCAYCGNDPFPAGCRGCIIGSTKGRRIKEIRNKNVFD